MESKYLKIHNTCKRFFMWNIMSFCFSACQRNIVKFGVLWEKKQRIFFFHLFHVESADAIKMFSWSDVMTLVYVHVLHW